MAEDQRRVVLRALPALIRVPPDEVNFLRILIQVGFVIARPPPDQLLDLRYRIVNEGRDVFQMFSFNRYSFFETTGETPETLLEIVRQLNNDMFQATGRPQRLSPIHRVMLFMLWMRSYPSYHLLSLLFDVSVATVHDEINWRIQIMWEHVHALVQWPSLDEWISKIGNWNKLPSAVGAIDGTSTEINRPHIEPQELYFSGHRHFHVIQTQVVVDYTGKICHIQSSFHRHQNDAQHFRLMSQIGHHQDLDFPQNVVLLADRIYPNGYPLMTPYIRRQLNVRPDNVRRKCRKLNRLITEYRVKVEHAICDLKHNTISGTLWRHPRRKLKNIVELCGAFVRRRQTLFYRYIKTIYLTMYNVF
jgi:hypothetical protein